MIRPLSINNGQPVSRSEVPLVAAGEWRQWILETCQKGGGRIVSLFADSRNQEAQIYGIVGIDAKGDLQIASCNPEGKKIASLTPDLPEAHLFERELFEETGIRPEGHPWLKPVRRMENYPFYEMVGEEIHEVAVGPVHAGIIEPGHFRFQCHGEKVFHLEIALGYQHRGVEKLIVSADPSRRAILVESIAGDTVIGHGLAYCHAIEGLSETSVSERAQGLRAIALELERLSNHAGDLGALASDIGFLTASAWFGRLRGEFLNLLLDLTGNRFGRSFSRPGGLLFDITKEKISDFKKRIVEAAAEMKDVADLFFTASSVLARLEGTGVVKLETAKSLGLVGMAARASNLMRDVRQQYPAHRLHPIPAVKLSGGDVYARARIRSLEGKKSCQYILDQLGKLAPDALFTPCENAKESSLVVSLSEGWRGEIVHCALTDERGEIVRYKIVDPSFHNWMALAIAMRDGQISDFPLCNKSFNLSYAGHDL